MPPKRVHSRLPFRQFKLLLLDEPSLGLSPGLAAAALERVQKASREMNTAVLIVEQKVREVMTLAHRVCGVKLGRVVLAGRVDEIGQGDGLKRLFP